MVYGKRCTLAMVICFNFQTRKTSLIRGTFVAPLIHMEMLMCTWSINVFCGRWLFYSKQIKKCFKIRLTSNCFSFFANGWDNTFEQIIFLRNIFLLEFCSSVCFWHLAYIHRDNHNMKKVNIPNIQEVIFSFLRHFTPSQTWLTF